MKLQELGEFGLIGRIAGRVSPQKGVRIGIGDDAAAVEPTAGFVSLFTTDMLVEGVHFDLAFTDPRTLGRKALSVNLSDIAAMGAIPRFFLLSLAIPKELPVEFVDDFSLGLLERGAEFGVSLIGGDTTAAKGGLVISVTVIGEQSPGLVVARSGARPGDRVWVSGTLGDSSLGLEQLQRGERDGPAVAKHLDPLPRVAAGLKLAAASIPTAMIDISDGLLADLGHILELSSTGARLSLAELPLSGHFREKQPAFTEDLFFFPLSGGEDYELLFTAPPEKSAAIEALQRETGTPMTAIGEITDAQGLSLFLADGSEYRAGRRGYNHFVG